MRQESITPSSLYSTASITNSPRYGWAAPCNWSTCALLIQAYCWNKKYRNTSFTHFTNNAVKNQNMIISFIQSNFCSLNWLLNTWLWIWWKKRYIWPSKPIWVKSYHIADALLITRRILLPWICWTSMRTKMTRSRSSKECLQDNAT